jgi:hypothetical protein
VQVGLLASNAAAASEPPRLDPEATWRLFMASCTTGAREIGVLLPLTLAESQFCARVASKSGPQYTQQEGHE